MMSDYFKQYKGVWRMSTVWWFTVGARCVDTSYYQIMVVPRLRIGFYC